MKIRTIVVDDDIVVRMLHARYILELEDFELVAELSTGVAAITAAASGSVDLVLLDIHLPDVSGIEVLHRIRSLAAGDIDVIILSSSADPTIVSMAASAGVAGYLIKPFSRNELVSRLQMFASSRESKAAQPAPSTGSVRILGQEQIDGVIRRSTVLSGSTAHSARLPKGLSEPTALKILDAISTVEPSPVADIAIRAGVSAVTVRRYLDRFREDGVVQISHRYGSPGRPEVRYVRK